MCRVRNPKGRLRREKQNTSTVITEFIPSLSRAFPEGIKLLVEGRVEESCPRSHFDYPLPYFALNSSFPPETRPSSSPLLVLYLTVDVKRSYVRFRINSIVISKDKKNFSKLGEDSTTVYPKRKFLNNCYPSSHQDLGEQKRRIE
jgi:hypothetical protein